MSCKQVFSILFLMVLCLSVMVMPSLAVSESEADAAFLAEIEKELAADEAAAAKPSISPFVGGMDLVVLFIFGAITSRKHKQIEDEGYEPVHEEHCIGNPYSRLAGKKKRRRWF